MPGLSSPLGAEDRQRGQREKARKIIRSCYRQVLKGLSSRKVGPNKGASAASYDALGLTLSVSSVRLFHSAT